ncbi:hypothetical protein [Sphingomonas sp. BK345]|uniref:hypothetical protein n=1 Tax=Sphingomonas sp. BK345 TaxID=2586980 RepID=UPI00161AB438|nr:hypothetical protein [Sphingomonas sp. BK345]MBB3473324.1 CHASE2 domain-containing sensor protein [Sphingomonas sp. BK345]
MRAPRWYRLLVGVLLLWSALSAYACVTQLMAGAGGAADPMDRALLAALPGWYWLDYAVASFGLLVGALAMVVRRRIAVPALTVSLVAALIQFGWLFAMTDLLARRGAGTLFFPLLILLVGAVALQLAHLAARRGWIG